MTRSPSHQLSDEAMLEAADRFMQWSRSEAGATTCLGVAEGSFKAENELLRAFVDSIHPPEPDDD